MACSSDKVDLDRGQLEFSNDDIGDHCERADAFFGSHLVIRVYDQLVQLSENDKVRAWGENDTVKKDEIMKYVEESRTSKTNCWTIPQVSASMKKKDSIFIKPVKPDPPMNYWTKTPVNIPTPDSTFLSHIPFLGDDFEKHDKNGVFTDNLIKNYGGNLHDDQTFDEIPICSEVMINLIRVLTEVGKRYEEIFSPKWNPSIDKPSRADLREIINKVITGKEKKYAQRKPTSELFDAVALAFEVTKPSMLKERYVQLSKRRDPSFDSVKNAPKNVDEGTDNKVRVKQIQMDSYGSLFCRLCFKYACIQHVLLNSEEISSMKAVAKLQRIENEEKLLAKKSLVKTIPRETITCTFQPCQKDIAEDQPPKSRNGLKKRWEKLKTEWSTIDRTMFNCLYDSYENFCIVASLLNNKTCVEVRNYHRLHTLMIESGCIHSPATSKDSKVDEATCSSSSSELTASGNGSFKSSMSSPLGEEVTGGIDNTAELYTFAPCCHKDGVCDESCLCVVGKKFCETPCGCLKSCKNRFKGCVCTTTCDSKRCPCYCASRECDPDLCQRCCSHELDINKVKCKNVSIQRKLKSPIELKPSMVSGWGAFASTSLKKGDFIGEYTAELISDNEADRRGHIYDEKSHTYLFTLTENQLILDAARLGSECRFINSSKKPNCQVRNTTVRGENHLAIVACKDIEKGTELFINYHQVLEYCKTKKKLKQKSKKYIDKT